MHLGMILCLLLACSVTLASVVNQVDLRRAPGDRVRRAPSDLIRRDSGYLIRRDLGYRIRRAPGDAPPAGQCCTFRFGGTTGIHFYTCCNNAGDADKSCDKTTYHTASDNNYCGTGGSDDGNGNMGECYKCGGCEIQDKIKKACSKWWWKIPGFCWGFINCFKAKCKKVVTQDKRQLTADERIEDDTCFNGVCDIGETPDNCPVDCCGTVNPKCKPPVQLPSADFCLPECCGESTCCRSA